MMEIAKLKAVEQSVLAAAAISYLDVYRDRQLLEIREEISRALTQRVQEVENQFDAGVVTKTDVFEATARLATSVSDRRQTEAALRASEASYEQVVGRRPGPLTSPPETIGSNIGTLMDLRERLERDNPEIQAAVYEVLLSKLNKHDERGKLLPTVELKLSANRRDNQVLQDPYTVSPWRVEDVAATIKVSLPLFDNSNVYSRIAAAGHEERQSVLSQENVANGVVVKLTTQWARYQAAQQTILEIGKAVEAYRQALAGLQAEQLAGTRTVAEVLNAEFDLAGAKASLLSAEHDTKDAVIQLAQLVGTLNPSLPMQ